MAETTEQDEFLGSQELVQILRMVVQARLSYPANPQIEKLYKAIVPMMDGNLCEALLIQTAQQQEQINSQRDSPLAQLIKAQKR